VPKSKTPDPWKSGGSAPLKALMKEYGFIVEHVVAAAEAQLALVAQS